MTVDDPALAAKCGEARFYSATYRLFNIEGLEPGREDYGQAVVYTGTVPGHPDAFELDASHRFETGKVVAVCGNTFRMLTQSRFKDHFTAIGDTTRHFGAFPGSATESPLGSDARATVTAGAAVPLAAAGGACC